MVRNIKILLVIIATLFLSQCNPVDPEFKDDVINGPEKFQFDPNKLPIIGVTTEKELLRMYPNPSTKWTFKKPIPKEILGKKFNMEKMLDYTNLVTEQISSPSVSGYVGKDYLYFFVFIEKGIVQQYLIKHKVKKKSNSGKFEDRFGVWIEGKYNRMPTSIREMEMYPDSPLDGACYWAQRKDRAQFRGGNTHVDPCPYWETVPAW